MADVPVAITTPSSGKGDEPLLATQRRITPSWTVGFLKGKLETMTGIPPGSQRLLLKSPGKPDTWLDADDETVGSYGLYRGCEIEVYTHILVNYSRQDWEDSMVNWDEREFDHI